nr:hypothetical protein [Tanacetum cinerariifolium]GEY72359.1 hypothetical protein [Tanacetum cinerariifolium]
MLAGIFSRRVHWVHVLDFEGMTVEIDMDIDARLRMRHKDTEGLVVFISHIWRRLFDIIRPLVRELMLEFFSMCRQFILAMGLHTSEEINTEGFRAYWADSSRTITSRGDLSGYWKEISSFRDFLSSAPYYIRSRIL